MGADPRLQRIVEAFERLAPEDVERLHTLYAPDAGFKDPFNEVRGVPAIANVFRHMFRTLEAPRFRILTAVAQGDEAFVTWDFDFLRRGDTRPWRIHGATHLRLAADGRIAMHRDYWDAAEELYAKLPVLGALMRWLRRRAAA